MITVKNNTRYVIAIMLHNSHVVDLPSFGTGDVPEHVWDEYVKRAHVRAMLELGSLVVLGDDPLPFDEEVKVEVEKVADEDSEAEVERLRGMVEKAEVEKAAGEDSESGKTKKAKTNKKKKSKDKGALPFD